MSDIKERLRGGQDEFSNTNLAHEAADYIEQLEKKVSLIDTLREAVEDAADEFGQMVDVDRAPMTCSKYVLRAFDTALSHTK